MRRLVTGSAAMAALALLVVSGALAQRVEVPVNPAAEPVMITAEMDDVTLLSAIASAMAGTLELPLSSPLYAHFYDSEEAFEKGLVRDAGADPAHVGDHVRFATGVGSDKGIFLRRDRLTRDTVAPRAGLFAHELTHVAQRALSAGKRIPAEWWLGEGHADWMKYQVLERLGVQTYAKSRLVQVREIKRAGPLGELPRLTTLSTQRGWVTARDKHAKGGTYAVAFFATEYLVETKGANAILTYYRREQPAKDRAAAFKAAFGVTIQEFSDDFADKLAELIDRK
jgi:hypothetical protein